MSSHLANIPEAVRIAASTDPSTDPGLKQQAIDYLNKVRELCEETWQVRPIHLPSRQSVQLIVRIVWHCIFRELVLLDLHHQGGTGKRNWVQS